jgi:hypothetical protein
VDQLVQFGNYGIIFMRLPGDGYGWTSMCNGQIIEGHQRRYISMDLNFSHGIVAGTISVVIRPKIPNQRILRGCERGIVPLEVIIYT